MSSKIAFLPGVKMTAELLLRKTLDELESGDGIMIVRYRASDAKILVDHAGVSRPNMALATIEMADYVKKV